MNILSWNVNGLGEDKRSCENFVQFISNYDIIFLYETWASKKTNLELKDYECINFYRKFQHRNAKRASGGVALYYKKHLKDGIMLLKNHSDTVIWIKLDKNVFNLSQDMYLCGCYIWCQESPAYDVVNLDLFELLENDVSIYEQLGSVFVIGDFNSRVGKHFDFIVHDYVNSLTDDENYVPDSPLPRASIDTVNNSHGTKLLDLCKLSGLRIANGRFDNTNCYTYISPRGMSVIDYLLTREYNFSLIKRFTIESLNEWSDHCPLSFSVCSKTHSLSNDGNHETIFKWSNEKRDIFRSQLISKLPDFNQIVKDVNTSDKKSINDTLNSFTRTLREIADPLFSQVKRPKKKHIFSRRIVH